MIYGDNASGKSGYARVMKKALRARAVEPILQNVYAAKQGSSPASAIFEVQEGDEKPRDEIWIDGKPSPECLGCFAVFDSRCARVYINESNELTFLPYGFDIINGLASITDEVKKQFQVLAETGRPAVDALRPLIDKTSIGNMIASLSASTKEDDVQAQAGWSEADDVKLSGKEIDLARLKTSAPKAISERLTSQKKRLETMRSEIAAVSAAISDETLKKIKSAVADLATCEQAVEAAAKTALGDADIVGIGGDAWRELILAAARFSLVAYPGEAYPTEVGDAKCVLCLQPLGAQAQERLDRFWKFVQEEASAKREAAKDAVEAYREALKKTPRTLPKHIEVLEGSLDASELGAFEKTKTYFGAIEDRVVPIEKAISSGTWDSIPPSPVPPLSVCDEQIASVVERIDKSVDDGKADAIIAACESEIAELKARKRLSENLTQVTGYLKALKLSARAAHIAKDITTNAILVKAGELQKRYVTEAFTSHIRIELETLGLKGIRAGIDKRTEKGKVLHKVVINGVPHAAPDAVFSEGERTAISLACFFGELSSGGDEMCGMVFDDPVSSLDHRIRHAVARRLVAAAAEKQVIVFTHDLVFFRELVGGAEHEKVDVVTQNVERVGTTVGILSSVPPWSVQKVNQRIALLEQVVKAARERETEGNVEEYRRLFREFYALLRSTWERAVEEVLFNQVVQRLERAVITMRLDGVQVDDESVKAVFDGMTKTSGMLAAHDHATASGDALPAADELAMDLDAIRTFIQSQKKKRDAAQKRNEHLK